MGGGDGVKAAQTIGCSRVGRIKDSMSRNAIRGGCMGGGGGVKAAQLLNGVPSAHARTARYVVAAHQAAPTMVAAKYSENPTAEKMPEIIQKRRTTRVSDQPFFSK